ncbi:MAG: TlpA family protein disulfide reductase [Gammaproteobacteria bacterium]|nr:TlpA family protein disulfide reductase [Gammaproteobacteria bacterium]
MKNKILISLLLITALLIGIGSQQLLISSAVPIKNSAVIGTQRPPFILNDIHDVARNVNEWDQQILIVNFWATWCPPCRKEIPALMSIQKEYADQGLQVIGIAVDSTEAVREYAQEMGIQYPLMAADLAAMEISRRYGNTSNTLPFTAFINRSGKIVTLHNGELTRNAIKDILQPLL